MEWGCYSDCQLKVLYEWDGLLETIATGDDCAMRFAHAAWREGVVSVFVDGGFCGPIRVAYDTRRHSVVAFETTAQWLAQDMQQTYGISDVREQDVFA